MTPWLGFADYWPLYLGFTGLVVLLLTLDLLVQRNSREITIRSAALWTSAWIGTAVAFGWAVYVFAGARFGPAVGRQLALEYAAGYVVEKSLSVDNMFVFALVFRYFAIPSRYQRRVLFYGVLGAIVLRALFIAAGSVLVRLEAVLIAFGVFLIFSGVRMAREVEKPIDPGRSRVLQLLRRFLPVTPDLRGGHFFVRLDGRLYATPLLVVVFFLESTDVLFAVDSVPAVFGVTREPFLVYSSNIFAILGLRAMFLLLSGALERFHVLKYGLAGVLVFVGLKMVWLDRLFGGRFPIGISLAIIAAAILLSIVISLLFPRGEASRRPRHAKLLGLVAGCVCFWLAVAAILYAAGPAREWLPIPGVVAAGAAPFYVSAACYAVCAIAFIVSRRQPRQP